MEKEIEVAIALGKMPKGYLSKSKNHKRGKHDWVAHCDEKGDELFGYCECCGKIRSD